VDELDDAAAAPDGAHRWRDGVLRVLERAV
jgi:hypothetical protein